MEPELNQIVTKLDKATKDGASALGIAEIRYLVDAYYMIQDGRKASSNQAGALARSGENNGIITWLLKGQEKFEGEIAKILDQWSGSLLLGRWARSICGIGPVIAAGLMAHIEIEKAPTAGHIWRFAGLDPTVKWGKGQKRPWNATLKTLCAFKIGESFVKVQNSESDIYGKVYAERKLLEMERNEQGLFADQAAAALAAKKYGKDTTAKKCYEQGKLPPAHIHRRAVRPAVKLFLSHYQWVAHEIHYGYPPPRPYIIERGGHSHFIAPPNWPMK